MTTTTTNKHHSSSPPPPQQQQLSLPLITRLKLFLLRHLPAAALHGTVPASPSPFDSVSSHDITVDDKTNLWFRLFIPETKTTDSDSDSSLHVIVYFHGGGFCSYSADHRIFDSLCRRLASTLPAVVVSVNYRLAPQHKFPSQFDDGFQVLEFLDTNRNSIDSWPKNADLGRCFLAGDSAGGNLAHNLAIRVAGEGKFSEVKVIGLILIQPFFGGVDRVESEIRFRDGPILNVDRSDGLWRAVLGDGLDRDYWAVNVSGPNAVELDGLDLPPVVVFVGGFDPLRDWQLMYGEWLKRKGKSVELVDLPGAFHGFYGFPEMEEHGQLIAAIKGFVEKHWSSDGWINDEEKEAL